MFLFERIWPRHILVSEGKGFWDGVLLENHAPARSWVVESPHRLKLPCWVRSEDGHSVRLFNLV